jgi:sugar lactone lactonase YvrE
VRSSTTDRARAGGRTRLLLALIIIAALGVLALPSAAFAGGFVYSDAFGASGTSSGQLNFPNWVSVGPGGTLYISDWNQSCIYRYTADGAYLDQFGTFGSGAGQFNGPQASAVDIAHGCIYVSDVMNNRVEKFSLGGTYLSFFGSVGSGNVNLSHPRGLAVDAAGNVWVVDTGNAYVKEFSAAGAFITKIGSPGSGDGQLSNPIGLAIAADGTVWVSDPSLARVSHFATDGTFLGKFGSSGTGDGQFTWCFGLAVDPSGDILVADLTTPGRIERFSSDGTWLASTPTTPTGALQSPYNVAIDRTGAVYTVDLNGSRIVKFLWDDTPPVFKTDSDGEWHSQPFDVTLSATDDLSGVDPTSFNWMPSGSGTWTTTNVYHQDTPAGHSLDGVHKIYGAVADLAGNWNAPYPIFRTKVDTRKPVTQLIGEVSWWVNTDVGLTFVGSDVGSGVAGTEYSTDHGTAWHPVPDNGQVIVSAEGTTEISYRSFDNCVDMPNVEDYKTTWTYIDKTKPTTHALNNVTVKKGAVATFKFDVLDNLATYCGMSLTIKKLSKIVKVINLGSRPSAAPLPHIQSKKATITLRAGTYTWFVTAYDDAGNFTKSLAKKLIVK